MAEPLHLGSLLRRAVLRHLAQHPTLTHSDIARAAHLSPNNLHRTYLRARADVAPVLAALGLTLAVVPAGEASQESTDG